MTKEIKKEETIEVSKEDQDILDLMMAKGTVQMIRNVKHLATILSYPDQSMQIRGEAMTAIRETCDFFEEWINYGIKNDLKNLVEVDIIGM